ncbi:hypothetical protein KY285_005159 [Solanum tuberosum]|nr:hypothetical protein KY284_006608 [Solanum tuberosum]KAH0752011.1 hypothetical protein KY285_005159 [Solanum tuberosum]
MLIGLSCKNKLGLINGTLRRPTPNTPLFEPWTRANDMFLALLLNSLELEIRESVVYIDFADKLWKLQHQNVSQPNQHNSHNNTPATSTSYRRSVDSHDEYVTQMKNTFLDQNGTDSAIYAGLFSEEATGAW